MDSRISVTLVFSDGVAHRLEVPGGSRLVDAASAAGLNLLTDCSNGQCGTCTAQLLSGVVEMGDYSSTALPDEDRAAGTILPCVCQVNSACVVELPYDSSEALAEESPVIEGTVTLVRQVASETMLLEVAVADGVFFQPGQYVRIQPAGTDISRSYSMANVPGDRQLQFFIRMVEGGAFSGWLSGALAGDKVQMSAPHGTFFLRDEPRPRLFVAGGTGVAPFLSMLRSMNADARAIPTIMLLGARTPGHLFALDELQALRSELPHVNLQLAVEQDATQDCHQGYATDLIGTLGLASNTRVYLCGPPPMVEAGRRAAESAGLLRQDVLCERFT